MRRRIALALGLSLAALAAGPGGAEVRSRTYPATTADIRNPERGFWWFIADDFARADDDALDAVVQQGLTVGYAVVRLDSYKTRPLTDAFLARLSGAFAKARARGIKVILRFAYNYPDTPEEEETETDAALPVVLGHIRQIKPVIAANADTILVWQAGFIGLWGEGHSSSNGLDSAKNKAIIRDALLAALPPGRQLQWRYPADLIRWDPDPPAAGAEPRIGFHNDCFLASNTDVGTYSENAAVRAWQRSHAARLTRWTLFSGETCDVQKAEARTGCADILKEGRTFHLTTLNGEYAPVFLKRWRDDGCYGTVRRSMGYRLELVRASASTIVVSGRTTLVRVEVRNVGWARLTNPRRFQLVAVHRATGRTYVTATRGDIRRVEPEDLTPTAFLFAWAVPASAPTGLYDLALALPDGSVRLAKDPRQAVRFANASGSGFGWDSRTGRYRLGLAVRVERP